VDDRRLDGNAIGGELMEIFGTEMTVATGVCGSCGAHQELAELRVYLDAPGVVGRCRACQAVVLRIVHGSGRTWLDLSGMSTLELTQG
jgi:hypothetical protein